MPYSCSSCGLIADYYSDDVTAIKNTGLCISCGLKRIESIIDTYRLKDVLFAFDEDIDYDGEDLKISGYTYFTYDIGSQMYVPDVDELVQHLKEKGTYDSLREQAAELYGEAGDYEVCCILDRNEYKQRAESIANALSKYADDEEVKVEITDTDDHESWFVDIAVSLSASNHMDKFFSGLDMVMDDVKDAVMAGKF